MAGSIIDFYSAFERARKQEIDALNKQAESDWERSLSATYATYLPTKPGECPPDCTQESYEDDGPESYDELLADIDLYFGRDSYDTSNEEIAGEAGDTKLEAMLIQLHDLEDEIKEHAMAMQAARNEAKQRPGVMISAGDQLRSFMGVGADHTAGLKAIAWGAGPSDIVADLKKAAEKMLGKPLNAERTCTTCSKTCDVGAKCWWCGNA